MSIDDDIKILRETCSEQGWKDAGELTRSQVQALVHILDDWERKKKALEWYATMNKAKLWVDGAYIDCEQLGHQARAALEEKTTVAEEGE